MLTYKPLTYPQKRISWLAISLANRWSASGRKCPVPMQSQPESHNIYSRRTSTSPSMPSDVQVSNQHSPNVPQCMGVAGQLSEMARASVQSFVSSSKVAVFGAHLDLQGYAASTIQTYISAISYNHKLSGYQEPGDTFLIKKTMEAIFRNKPATDPQQPITLHLLKDILQHIGRVYQGHQRALHQSAFSLAFQLCAMVVELAISNGNHIMCCS